MAELKQCPFCGGKPNIVCFTFYDDDNDEDEEGYSVECKNCGCCTPFMCRESAEETWNRRAEDGTENH